MADLHDVQHSILEMQAKRSRLGIKKAVLQQDCNKYKEMLKVIQQGHETFNEIVEKRKEKVAELQDIETELSELKQSIKKRQLLKEEVLSQQQPKNVAMEADLLVLRDDYLKFAGDKTRVASMRSMAAEFAEKLTKVLKRSKLSA